MALLRLTPKFTDTASKQVKKIWKKQKIREIEEKSENMPFNISHNIRAALEWKQTTLEGPYVIHFDRTESIDDLTGLPLGLKIHFKFETDYNTEPKINVKVVEGLELLRSVSIHVGCASKNMSFNDCYIPMIQGVSTRYLCYTLKSQMANIH